MYKTIIKGAIIGSTMTIPGISGGTMAIIIGIYEKLIHSVNSLKVEFKKSAKFLCLFLLGALPGFLIFARIVTMLLANPYLSVPTKIIFCVIVIASIPNLIKKENIKFQTNVLSETLLNIGLLIVGVAVVVVISMLPNNLGTGIDNTETINIYTVCLYLISGVIIAIALVLPGISASYMLYVIGIYETIVLAIYSMKLQILIPLGIGIIIGTLASAKAIEKLMISRKRETYIVIIGFLLGSLWIMF